VHAERVASVSVRMPPGKPSDPRATAVAAAATAAAAMQQSARARDMDGT
jgi:hypothetical protein